MATPTSSSNRSKRKTNKPVTTSKGRQNRSAVSTAKVTNSDGRGSNKGSAKVTTGKDAAKPTPKALPPGTKGGPLATQGRASLKGQPQLPPGRKGGPMEKAGPTVDVKANSPKLKGSTPKPSGNYKAPSIPKPTAAAPKPNALSRNLKFGRGNVAAMVLGAANAADDSRLTPAQLRKKYEVVDPNRGQRIADNLLGLNQKPRPKQGDAQSRFAGARDANLNRINNDPKFAAPKAQGKPKAENKPARTSSAAPSMPRAVTASTASRSASSASTSAPTPTRKGSDQAKNRGSYASQFKEETSRMTAASLVRQQNRGNMTSEDLKPKKNDNIKTKQDGTTTVYEPKTKVNAPDYSRKPIDQAKVEEYGRRKKRYYS